MNVRLSTYESDRVAQDEKRIRAINQILLRKGLKAGIPLVREYFGLHENRSNLKIAEIIETNESLPEYNPYLVRKTEELKLLKTYQRITGRSVDNYQRFRKALKSLNLVFTVDSVEVYALFKKRCTDHNLNHYQLLKTHGNLFYWLGEKQPLELFQDIENATGGKIKKERLLLAFSKPTNKGITPKDISELRDIILQPALYQ